MAGRTSCGTSSVGITKSLIAKVSSRFLILASTESATKLEEVDVALFAGFLLQHLAGDFLERCLNSGLSRNFFRGFVDFESELPAQHIYGGSLRRVGAFAAGLPHFGGDGVHVGSGHRRVYCAHVDHASGFDAVQPDVAADRRSMVKL